MLYNEFYVALNPKGMTMLRLIFGIIWLLGSLYFGINWAIAATETPGGAVVFAIVFVIGLLLIWGIPWHIVDTIRKRRRSTDFFSLVLASNRVTPMTEEKKGDVLERMARDRQIREGKIVPATPVEMRPAPSARPQSSNTSPIPWID